MSARRLRAIRAISALVFVLVCAGAYAVGYYLLPIPE